MTHDLLVDPAAVVADGDNDLRGGGIETERDMLQPLGMDQSVGDQVIEKLLDQNAVGDEIEALLPVEAKADVRPQQGNAVDHRMAERRKIQRRHGHGQLFPRDAPHDRGVIQQPRDAENVSLYRAQIAAELAVSALLGAALGEVGRKAQIHQSAAHRKEEGVVDQRGRDTDFREKQGLQIVQPGGAHIVALACKDGVGCKDPGLRLTDLRTQQRCERFADAAAAQQLFCPLVGIDDPPGADQHGRLRRERQYFGRNSKHDGPTFPHLPAYHNKIRQNVQYPVCNLLDSGMNFGVFSCA